MKANKQSKIKVKQSGYKRSRFNWNHDVNTTFSWGEIQPVGCKMIQPNSKTTVKTQNLIRLAPMVAPTFGRVKYKTFNQFVDVADIFPNYDAMMAQEPVNRNGRTKVPQKIPSIKLGQLSSWCYQGAKATIYWVPEDQYTTNVLREQAAAEGKYYTWFKPNLESVGNTIPNTVSTMLDYIFGGNNTNKPFQPVPASSCWTSIPGAPKLQGDWYSGSTTNVNYIQMMPKGMKSDSWDSTYSSGNTYGLKDYQIVLSNNANSNSIPLKKTLLPFNPSILADAVKENPAAAYISMESADSLIEFKINSGTEAEPVWHYYCLALEFSDYGKRIRKILQGCGYQIDIGSNEDVSILPLLAQYKAYFDIFGLQLYQGWETTYCAKLIDYIKNNFIEDIDFERYGGQPTDAIRIAGMPYVTNTPAYITDIFTSFCSFMFAEVAQEWYTEDPDWIGSHMSKLAVSPNGPDNFISVDGSGFDMNAHVQNGVSYEGGTLIDYGQVDNNLDSGIISNSTTNGVHSFINQIQHGQVDADLLKRLYKWTNRNSILGREIAKILRAQGLGDYVDECKSNFIGTTDNMITISDVVSMADTSTATGEGAVLGEYGGKGLQYIENQTLVFENDSLGYWITLACVVPEAGYTQGLDPTLTALDKFSLYNPDFDALGMELTKKSTIVGCNYDIQSVNSTHGDANRLGFGFTPRYSKFKVASNLVNGDFNRHNMRNTYLPYTLDKQIAVNDFDVTNEKLVTLTNGDVIGVLNLKRSLVPESLPVAGNIWRTPTKYPWLGHFNRIFMNTGDRRSSDIGNTGGFHGGDSAIGFTDFNSDNFLSHGIVEMTCYAPMKPIEDSYGLDDDDVGVTGSEFVTKA